MKSNLFTRVFYRSARQVTLEDDWDGISERAIQRATEVVSKGAIPKVITRQRREAMEAAVKRFDFKAAAKL